MTLKACPSHTFFGLIVSVQCCVTSVVQIAPFLKTVSKKSLGSEFKVYKIELIKDSSWEPQLNSWINLMDPL